MLKYVLDPWCELRRKYYKYTIFMLWGHFHVYNNLFNHNVLMRELYFW